MLKRRSLNPAPSSAASSTQRRDPSAPSSDAAPCIRRIKILSMGESGVGKSCLIKRYCEERFVAKYISTIGIDYGVKPVQLAGQRVHVNFWDVSGLSVFFEVRNEFYADTQGVVLVFDLTTRASFDALERWLEEAKTCGAQRFVGVLCGNKSDRPRVVSDAEARAFAAGHGLVYYETSACTGVNVSEAFEDLFARVLQQEDSETR